MDLLSALQVSRSHTKALKAACLGVSLSMALLVQHARAAELHLLHCWGEQRAEWVETMASEFSTAYPDVKVNVQLVGCGGPLHEAFVTSFLGGAPPDVVMVHSLNIPTLVDMGALAPLDAYRQKDNIPMDTWYPSEIASARWDGKVYGFPIRTGGDVSSLLYFNRDLFAAAGIDTKRPPATWGDLDETARKLVRYEGDKLVQAAIPLHGGDYSELSWLSNAGGMLVSADGRRAEFARAPAVEAATFANDHFTRRYSGGYQEANAFLTAFGGPYGGARNAFIQGRLAMQFQGSWEFSYIQTGNAELSFGIGLRTSKNPGGSPGIHAGTYHYSMSTGAKKPNMAFDLLKWLTLREESAGYFMLRQGRPSPVRAFNRNRRYLEANPDWLVIGEALNVVNAVPLYPFTQEVMGIFNTAFNRGARGQDAAGPALEEAAVRAQAVIDEFWVRRK